MGRTRLLAFVAGCAGVHLCTGLPGMAGSALLLALTLMAGVVLWRGGPRLRGRPVVNALGWLGFALVLGASSTAWRAQYRLQEHLAADQENRVLHVSFKVLGLAAVSNTSQRVDAELIDPPRGVPRRVSMAWYAQSAGSAVAPAIPGEVWRAAVVFKRPHGLQNPHGFDAEALMFERGQRASGTVRGRATRIADQPWTGFGTSIQRIRYRLRQAMLPALKDRPYGAVILALAMGDQASVPKEHWTVFSRTGITHLVSISGLHVTMMAALGGALVLLMWSRWSWRGRMLAERCPAQIAGATAALALAWLYCLVAGWGVPARRTFLMLAVVAGAAILRLPMTGTRVLALAAAAVTALDPWAPLAAGFWLSFGAVALLLVSGTGRWRRRPPDSSTGTAWQRRRAAALQALREAALLQAALTLGMLPLLVVLFQQVSLVSPLANALAIPVVSLIVTPLALLAMVACAVPGLAGFGGWCAAGAHHVFMGLMAPVTALSDWQFSNYPLAAPPWPLTALALAGAIWCLQPRGLPGRLVALSLLLPLLAFQPTRPRAGEWRLVALDVGQGGAVLIQTATHTLLFDTGPPFGQAGDAGERVIWPYLRAKGVRHLDRVVVSHGDADHAGGLASLLDALPVAQVMASYDAPAALRSRAGNRAWPPDTTFEPCVRGARWVVDDVVFELLHPSGPVAAGGGDSRTRNEASCVLRLQGRHHSALLTGDIGQAQERALIAPGGLSAHVVMAAHHGSRGSSEPGFVREMAATHVIAQVGYLNRYRHPHPAVAARWQRTGARFHRTDSHGAVTVDSSASGLRAVRHRESHRRYWHGS